MKKFITLFTMLSCLSMYNAQAFDVQLKCELNNWSSISAMTPVQGATNQWTLEWDLSSTAGDIQFGLVVPDYNNAWIGYFNDITVTAPQNWWVQKEGNNFKINNSKTGYKKYQITATWQDNGGNDAIYYGWNLVVEGVEHASYSVVGEATFFEDGWDDSSTACDMTFVSNNNYCEFTKTVSNKKGTYNYKIVREHSWNNASYPSENASFSIPSNDTYEVTFYFNPDEYHVGSKVSLKVVDGDGFVATEGFSVAEATYTRPLSYNWGTLCLPFAINGTYTGITFYQLQSVDTDRKVLSFEQISSVAAGQPVVFKAADNVDLNISETNVSVTTSASTSETVTGWVLHGSFASVSNYTPSGTMYFFSENQFWSGTPASIPAYRAWFDADANFGASPAPFRIEEADAEDIQFVEQEDGTVKAYYDLQGRKLNERKGLMIENGKIIMVK